MTITDPRPAIHGSVPHLVAPGASAPPGAVDGVTPNDSAPPEGNASRPTSADAPIVRATGAEPGPEALPTTAPTEKSLLDPALALAAAVLDDIEKARIANENRLRQLTRDEVDSDGLERGFGLPKDHPDVARVSGIVYALKQIEGDAVRNLQLHMKRHPLWPWIKVNRGVGEKQAARLLAAIGDPYLNGATGKPRTVSQLWAYSGLHVLPGSHLPGGTPENPAAGDQLGDQKRPGTHWESVTEGGDPGQEHGDTPVPAAGVAARRRKGVRSNWSAEAKMRAFLIAESCVKQLNKDCRGGHVADNAQIGSAVPAQEGAGQQVPDTRGTPASPQEGGGQVVGDTHNDAAAPCTCSPFRVKYDARRARTQVTRPEWTDGHRHNDALRVASKEILKQLWRAAKSWHDRQAEDG